MRLIKFTGKYERKGKKGTQARKKGATEIIVDQKSGPALAGPPDRRRRPCDGYMCPNILCQISFHTV